MAISAACEMMGIVPEPHTPLPLIADALIAAIGCEVLTTAADASVAAAPAASAPAAAAASAAVGAGGGAAVAAWDCIEGLGVTVLRHRRSGKALGLPHGSKGWLDFKATDASDEHCEYAGGDVRANRWTWGSRNLLASLRASPGANPLPLAAGPLHGNWSLLAGEGGLFQLINSQNSVPYGKRWLGVHGYTRINLLVPLADVRYKEVAARAAPAPPPWPPPPWLGVALEEGPILTCGNCKGKARLDAFWMGSLSGLFNESTNNTVHETHPVTA
jgi:hypothetical protein